jgi:ABC-type transporter Mla subunit MlaD
MKTSDLVMNIAVNLVRIARFAADDRRPRVRQFTDETQEFIDRLENAPKSERFEHTFKQFKSKFASLAKVTNYTDEYLDDLHTWANILTHRANLA